MLREKILHDSLFFWIEPELTQYVEYSMLELIIINYNVYGLICNKYILYNRLSNYIRNEVIKFCIGFIICHEK
jgi:hypothetical protein